MVLQRNVSTFRFISLHRVALTACFYSDFFVGCPFNSLISSVTDARMPTTKSVSGEDIKNIYINVYEKKEEGKKMCNIDARNIILSSFSMCNAIMRSIKPGLIPWILCTIVSTYPFVVIMCWLCVCVCLHLL